jgi:hypothetical protein
MASDQIRFDLSKGPANHINATPASGIVAAAASGGGITSGFSYGIQRVKYVITDGQIKLTVINQANNSQANSTVTLIPGFLVADVVAPLFYVYTTSGSSAWGDDLRISCNP